MKRKRILFILHWPPPVHGSSVVGLQIKESKVINETHDCHYVNLGTSKSIDEIGKNPIGKIFRYLSLLWHVLKQLVLKRPHLCYFAITVKGIGFYKDALLVIMVKLFRVKLVYHLHNKGIIERQHKYFDDLLYRFVFKNSAVILLSPLLYGDVEKYVSRQSVYFCANGIKNMDRIQRDDNPSNWVEILFLANIMESKGVYILLDACKILKEKKLQFHCTFIGGKGDISEEQFREKVAADGLLKHVSFEGKKHGEEKNIFLSKAAIFVLPTYYAKECFPLVLLEAMQASLAVISTCEGGIPDLVEQGKTGFLVPQKDATALAEKLELLIGNKNLRDELGANGRIRYEQNFTAAHFENRLNIILNDCLVK